MAELLKNMFHEGTLGEIALAFHAAYEPFQTDGFINTVMDDTWEKLELKARVRKISVGLGKYLPEDYGQAIKIMNQVIVDCPPGFTGIFFPDFVEVYGQDEENFELSVDALERYTPYSSAEFAVRPFIIKYEERMMERMYAWSKHENEHVRRLSSEGCRPALPWGQALTRFKKDPSPILPILEQLKADPSLYVRKSVANNLNDISKTHPELVAEIAKDWYGKNEYTDWIVKRGCRTLLKNGRQDVLAIFGYQNADLAKVEDFKLEPSVAAIGGEITVSFSLKAEEAAKVRLEYAVDYVKANGKRNRKIFQISETAMGKNETKSYTKRHSLADMTTRRHYPGTHTLTLIVNGVEKNKQDFELVL